MTRKNRLEGHSTDKPAQTPDMSAFMMLPTPLIGHITDEVKALYAQAMAAAKKVVGERSDPDSVGSRVAMREMQLRLENRERGDVDIIAPSSPEQHDWIMETINMRAKVSQLDEYAAN